MKRKNNKAMKQSTIDKRFKQSGWTLVELLVVVAIVAVLAALSFAMFRKAKASARTATCMSNVRQLGGAILMYASDHAGKLPALQPDYNPDTGKRDPIWPVTLARLGYMWDGNGELPCGKGVWTCPSCDYMAQTYGGYGVVEGEIFVYAELKPKGIGKYGEEGSLRLTMIDRPSSTWLVGDTTRNASEPNKGWYAIWAKPDRWNDHSPAERHNGKANVCMVDGRVVSLSKQELEEGEYTFDVLRDN